ncbi:Uncharacterised protein [Candidatus Burarchaeum australiense]|nr:Uncharacterised protein [Candidatus Burarchaeum australiense]
MEHYDNGASNFKVNPNNPVAVDVEKMKADIVNVHEKLKDPVFLGSLFHVAATERENTNRILKTLLSRLDSIESRLRALEASGPAAAPQMAPRGSPQGPRPPAVLPDVDFEIVNFVKQKGRVYANEVRRKFNYKGTNAACARLNRLFELGMLEKKQIGRRVYYFAKEVDVEKA